MRTENQRTASNEFGDASFQYHTHHAKSSILFPTASNAMRTQFVEGILKNIDDSQQTQNSSKKKNHDDFIRPLNEHRVCQESRHQLIFYSLKGNEKCWPQNEIKMRLNQIIQKWSMHATVYCEETFFRLISYFMMKSNLFFSKWFFAKHLQIHSSLLHFLALDMAGEGGVRCAKGRKRPKTAEIIDKKN